MIDKREPHAEFKQNQRGNGRNGPNQGLLYFCQLLDDMVWDGTRDSYRAPSLNTYHRCHEILRTTEEIRDSALREGILSPMFDELILLGASDPTVKRHFDSNWQELAFSFEKGGLQNKTFAVMRFLRRIDTAYLKRCRDEIQRIVDLGECKEKDRLERLAGDFCSYLLNVGHSSAQIKYVVNTRFFSRELEFPAKREVQDFFAEFPCRTNLFDVYSFTSSDLAQFLEGNSSQVVTGKVPPPVAGRYAAFIESAREFQIVVSRGVEAFDPSDARLRTEAAMALTRRNLSIPTRSEGRSSRAAKGRFDPFAQPSGNVRSLRSAAKQLPEQLPT